ncbi:metallophosphoesterase [Paenibacillus sp. UMB4589-SE434]|uniref:metallophosphoesterase n=1 Tax=Paenibacillus sp. UMB4589-SE434 TaxID=3046314 RepID=UPI00254BD212|nr:metallophosphoesterase [Paenibacillus sp. UMB4589-SE434]MDK8179448.1 metallophosphoesterase [Paenibacillus sp. UMB4589-SE434]
MMALGMWAAASMLAVLLIILILLLHMRRVARLFQVTEEEVWLTKLPVSMDGLRLFFISDLHRRKLTEEHMTHLKMHQQAQLVIIGGDVTERDAPVKEAIDNAMQLRTLGATVMVHGNHDHKGDTRRLDAELSSLGIRLLDNEAMRCEQGDGTMWIVGVDDLTTGNTNLDWALEAPRDEPHCCILISHDPGIIRSSIPDMVELVISGHTHGGQIMIPGYGPIKTSAFYRKYLAGWYSVKRGDSDAIPLKLFISRGFGTSHLPLRLGSVPEAHFITLRSGVRVS